MDERTAIVAHQILATVFDDDIVSQSYGLANVVPLPLRN